jgi:hypothetical protein
MRCSGVQLWLLLMRNLSMFAIELGVGIAAESTGLIADAMDMLADAAMYGIALYAVGRAADRPFQRPVSDRAGAACVDRCGAAGVCGQRAGLGSDARCRPAGAAL